MWKIIFHADVVATEKSDHEEITQFFLLNENEKNISVGNSFIPFFATCSPFGIWCACIKR